MKIKSFALFVAVLAVHLIAGGVTWVVTRKPADGERAAGEAQKIEQQVNNNNQNLDSEPTNSNNSTSNENSSSSPLEPPVIRTKTYKVKSGDRLSVIAGRHGVSVKKLMTVNKIKDQNKIYIGQKLTIPLD